MRTIKEIARIKLNLPKECPVCGRPGRFHILIFVYRTKNEQRYKYMIRYCHGTKHSCYVRESLIDDELRKIISNIIENIKKLTNKVGVEIKV